MRGKARTTFGIGVQLMKGKKQNLKFHFLFIEVNIIGKPLCGYNYV